MLLLILNDLNLFNLLTAKDGNPVMEFWPFYGPWPPEVYPEVSIKPYSQKVQNLSFAWQCCVWQCYTSLVNK